MGWLCGDSFECVGHTTVEPRSNDVDFQVNRRIVRESLRLYWMKGLDLAWDMQHFDTLPVHGEFVIEVRRGGDPAPLLLSPMRGRLLVNEKCDFSEGASAGQTGRSAGNWWDPSRSR